MKTKTCLCLCALAATVWAQEIPVQLSPMEKERLREQRHPPIVPGLPMPPNITNNYRITASLLSDQLHTQTLALVTVTIVTKAKTALVRDEGGKFKTYLGTGRPAVVLVRTNRYDLLTAPELP